jgi:hypothetical protein
MQVAADNVSNLNSCKKLNIFSVPFVTYVAQKTFHDFIKIAVAFDSSVTCAGIFDGLSSFPLHRHFPLHAYNQCLAPDKSACILLAH